MTPTQDPILAKVRADVQQAAVEDAAGREALAEPFPGPLKDIFAPVQDIPVGRWKVRAFYEIDFEFLSMLSHPLYKMMKAAMSGTNADDSKEQMARGPDAWALVWILTRSPDDVEAVLKDGGAAAVREKAKAEFSRLRLYGLTALVNATVKQIAVYMSAGIGYKEKPLESADASGEEVVAESPSTPFTSSAPQLTGSGG